MFAGERVLWNRKATGVRRGLSNHPGNAGGNALLLVKSAKPTMVFFVVLMSVGLVEVMQVDRFLGRRRAIQIADPLGL